MNPRSSTITRRSLLVRSAQAGVALGSLSLSPLFAAPRSRGFKIGACDWSLRQPSATAAFEVAKRIGVDGLQVSTGRAGEDMPLRRPEVQAKYLEAAKRTGLEIASLALAALNDAPLKSDPRAAKWLAESVGVCMALGLGVVLVPQFGAGDLDMRNSAEIDHLVKALKDAAPAAEKQGVIFGLENYLSAEDNRRIIDRVGSPAVRVYYDVGNSTDKGRDTYKEIRTLGKLICEFHFKDDGYLLGQGRIDFKQVRRAIDDIQYSGWIQIEAAAPHGVIPDYTSQCKFLKSLYPRAV